MFHSFHNCCQSFLFSHRNKLGLKRHMKKNAKMQDICNKETKTTAASLIFCYRWVSSGVKTRRMFCTYMRQSVISSMMVIFQK